MSNVDIDFIETIDLLSFTFSGDFIDKWSFKYGKRLPRLFQLKVLKSLEARKPLKLKNIHKFLTVDSGFNPDLVKQFLVDIEYDIYQPMISGSLSDLD